MKWVQDTLKADVFQPLQSSVAPCEPATAKEHSMQSVINFLNLNFDLLMAPDTNRGKKPQSYISLSSRAWNRNEVREVLPSSYASGFVFKAPIFPLRCMSRNIGGTLPRVFLCRQSNGNCEMEERDPLMATFISGNATVTKLISFISQCL